MPPEEVQVACFSRLTDLRVLDYHGVIAEDAEVRQMGVARYIFHRHGWRVEEAACPPVVPKARAGAGHAPIEAARANAAGRPHVDWTAQDLPPADRPLCGRIGEATPVVKRAR